MIVLYPTRGLAEAAVAFGQFGLGEWSSGSAHNQRSSAEAQSAAMQNCGAWGANCSIVKTFNNTCVAVAAQDGDNDYAVKFNRDLAAARQAALSACEAKGLPCTIAEAFCDNVSEAEIQAAERKKSDAEYQEFLRQWQMCFATTGAGQDPASEIAACDQAKTFANLQPSDRSKLTQQRANLVALQESFRQKLAREEQESRERAARDQQERALQEQREHEQREAQSRETARIVAQPDTRNAGKTPQNGALSAVPAAADVLPESLRGIPISTWVTGSVAGALAVFLGATLMRQRNHAAAGHAQLRPPASPLLLESPPVHIGPTLTSDGAKSQGERLGEAAATVGVEADTIASAERPPKQAAPNAPRIEPPHIVPANGAAGAGNSAAADLQPMAKGMGIAALCVALVAILVPVYGPLHLSALAIAIATVGALAGDRVFAVAVPVIAFVNFWFLSPSVSIIIHGMSKSAQGAAPLYFVAAIFFFAPFVAMYCHSSGFFRLGTRTKAK